MKNKEKLLKIISESNLKLSLEICNICDTTLKNSGFFESIGFSSVENIGIQPSYIEITTDDGVYLSNLPAKDNYTCKECCNRVQEEIDNIITMYQSF